MAAATRVRESLEHFLEQLPVDAYKGRLGHPAESLESDVPVRRLAEVAESALGKMLDRSKNQGVLRPYLRNANVRWGEIDTSEVLSMRISAKEASRYRLSIGDVLVCEGGEPGRAAVWRGEEEMYYQKALHRVRCKPDLDPEWLVLALQASAVDGSLARHFTGTGIMHLTAASVAKLPIALPPVAVQRQVLDLMMRLRRDGQQLMQNVARGVEHLTAAYEGYLARQLFPPDHEPEDVEVTSRTSKPQRVSEREAQRMEYPRLAGHGGRDEAAEAVLVSIRSIVESLGGSATATEVLGASPYTTDVDSFYMRLRAEIDAGSIREVVLSDHERVIRLAT
ncbi:restriction endonuclease subunit S [Geodermatophilus sp. URMC 60]